MFYGSSPRGEVLAYERSQIEVTIIHQRIMFDKRFYAIEAYPTVPTTQLRPLIKRPLDTLNYFLTVAFCTDAKKK